MANEGRITPEIRSVIDTHHQQIADLERQAVDIAHKKAVAKIVLASELSRQLGMSNEAIGQHLAACW